MEWKSGEVLFKMINEEKEQILENHKRRIKRAGPKLWDGMQCLVGETGTLSGILCLEICNTYGIRMCDLMLFLDILTVKYDFDEWYSLKKEQEERFKNMRQCTK
jgi:hypothetical protein